MKMKIKMLKEMTYIRTNEYKLEDDDKIWVENELSKMGIVKMKIVAKKLKSVSCKSFFKFFGKISNKQFNILFIT